mmetsp:Transcript_24067/g.33834  ORF Transcript_24067/g.33834 Transcript_24067/m.33834 type:complete len:82 (-) Transcript_24067:214-459(-)
MKRRKKSKKKKREIILFLSLSLLLSFSLACFFARVDGLIFSGEEKGHEGIYMEEKKKQRKGKLRVGETTRRISKNNNKRQQ